MKAGAILAVALLLGSAGTVAAVQPNLAERVHALKEQEDVYVLPPPKQLRAITLGYHAAAADILWAKVLVEYGIHITEKRTFPDLTKYLDAVLALEPDYAPLYRFVDTLIVFHYPRATEDDARVARRYLERGLRERPYDHNMWLQYGQFVAYLAPSFLESNAEKERWRKEGSEAILRAVELGAEADRALGAASILSKGGEQSAVIAHLRRARFLTDDPDTQAQIDAKLALLQDAERNEADHVTRRTIEDAWRRDFPFLRRGEFLQIGPTVDPLRCAGFSTERECSRAWGDRLPSHGP